MRRLGQRGILVGLYRKANHPLPMMRARINGSLFDIFCHSDASRSARTATNFILVFKADPKMEFTVEDLHCLRQKFVE